MYLPCLHCVSKEDDRSCSSEEYKGQHQHSKKWGQMNNNYDKKGSYNRNYGHESSWIQDGLNQNQK